MWKELLLIPFVIFLGLVGIAWLNIWECCSLLSGEGEDEKMGPRCLAVHCTLKIADTNPHHTMLSSLRTAGKLLMGSINSPREITALSDKMHSFPGIVIYSRAFFQSMS